MEENKKNGQFEARPVVMDLKATNQFQPTLPTTIQPPAEGIGASMTPHKSKKLIKYILISFAAIPVIVIGGYILTFLVNGQIKMLKLQHAANSKLEKLERMLPVDKKVTDAKGVVDGDALTANSDPVKSTTAYLSFENKGSLREIETQLAESMAKWGFTRDGGDTNPYYKATSPAYTGGRLDNINRIELRYSNSQDAIRITYELDKYYACPKEYICERTEKTKSSEKIYDIRSFASLPVHRVSVYYASKNYYQAQL